MIQIVLVKEQTNEANGGIRNITNPPHVSVIGPVGASDDIHISFMYIMI